MYQNILSVDEQNYWKKWVRDICEGGRKDWLATQVNSKELDDLIKRDLSIGLIDSNQVKLLDVGAGPIGIAGSLWGGSGFEIIRHCQDPLGDYYKNLLSEYGVDSPLYLVEPTETLDTAVVSGFYNYIFCRNALDHATDAVRAVRVLHNILAPGGIIRLRHYENEGIYANYSGLHRWNFMEARGHALVFSQCRVAHISEIVGSETAVLAYKNSEFSGRKDDGSERAYCEFVIFKESWDRDIFLNIGNGITMYLSNEGRAIKIAINRTDYDESYPLFLHLHMPNSHKATTIVWGEGESIRTIPLISADHEIAARVAIGQYEFIETDNHYAPKYNNKHYCEVEVDRIKMELRLV